VTRTPADVERGRSTRRNVDGIVLLDKPYGWSSNQALQRVKRLLFAAKAGHGGTLDPLATGMLPIGLGQATKTCGALLGATKAYRVRLALGTATSTGDAEGQCVASALVPALDFDDVQRELLAFIGRQQQTPPMYSALKREGRPLYQMARAGESVDRSPRDIEIHAVVLRACEPQAIEFDVTCSKGTYVRVLGEDIARRLRTVGHLAALRRLWVDPFAGEPMVTLAEIEDWSEQGASVSGTSPWLLPVDRGLARYAALQLDAASARALRQGRTVVLREPAGTKRVYGPNAAFLGLVDVDSSGVARVRRFFVGAP